jgi:L-arabinokinase
MGFSLERRWATGPEVRDYMVRHMESFIRQVKKSGLFNPAAPVFIARAPGRLDVMGGIADYSGSLVLQWPIAEATFAAVQLTGNPVIEIVSVGELPRAYTLQLGDIALGYAEARSFYSSREDTCWVSYIAGVFMVLSRECRVSIEGARVFIASNVPQGKGVASSAALEVAVMAAVCGAFDIHLEPQELALLCQRAENLVAGAPCGIMDQMTSACGESNFLLALLCQPAELQPRVPVPDDIRIWGVDSGERHAVSGSDYSSVRAAAFMGHRMIAMERTGWNDYLANITVEEFEREWIHRLPEETSGDAFLARYSGTTDIVTTVDPARLYKVRKATAHPVYEHDRVQKFQRLLTSPLIDEQRVRLGDLMYQSHQSYTACGLGSPGTDLLVNLVKDAGPAKGLYGARITGGGSGGTVAVIGSPDANPAIQEIVKNYADRTGYRPYLFSGSSSGVQQSGVLQVRLNEEKTSDE